MLVALQTLPGWPAVPNPSVLRTLAILVGLPLLVTLIIVALVKLSVAKTDVPGTGEALWLRGDQPEAVAGGARAPAIEPRRAAENQQPGAEQGGASARW
jgi:hypothetical protein